jgi:hypothetical protein
MFVRKAKEASLLIYRYGRELDPVLDSPGDVLYLVLQEMCCPVSSYWSSRVILI